EGHDGLAGAGAAGDEGRAAAGGTDRGVLLGLDGGDDVPHAARALAAQSGHERAVADDGQLPGRLLVEQVVADLLDLPAEGADDAAAGDLLAVDGGGAVERRGGGGAPVHQEGAVLGVADAEAAHVADAAAVEVEAPEGEPYML